MSSTVPQTEMSTILQRNGHFAHKKSLTKGCFLQDVFLNDGDIVELQTCVFVGRGKNGSSSVFGMVHLIERSWELHPSAKTLESPPNNPRTTCSDSQRVAGLHDPPSFQPPLARTWGTHLLLQLWVPYPEATISAPLADSRKGHPLSRSCGCCRQRVWHDVLFSQPLQQKPHAPSSGAATMCARHTAGSPFCYRLAHSIPFRLKPRCAQPRTAVLSLFFCRGSGIYQQGAILWCEANPFRFFRQ